MKIKSKLADLDFQFGAFEHKKDHLIIQSAPDQPMQARVYLSPDDILSILHRVLVNPRIWLYFWGFPFFLIRYRRRKKAQGAAGKRKMGPN